VIPTTALMLFIIAFFFGIKDNPIIQSMLKAVRPVVVGLLIWTAYDMANSVFGAKNLGWGQAFMQGWDKIALVVVSFALLTFTTINPVFIIIGAAILGLIFYR
jgi:chromate transporter